MPDMSLDIASLTSAGPRRRNEDSFVASELRDGCAAIAIADGLGGHAGGDIASKHAVDRFIEMVSGNPMPMLVSVATAIHSELQAMQSARPDLNGMSTTLSAGCFCDGQFTGIHCGDSRIAVSRGAGIKRLTEDHTEVQRLLRAGQISREAARAYSRRNVLESALGAKVPLRLDEIQFLTSPGDRFFFTTDGVHDKILLREMQQISQRYASPRDVVSALAAEVENRGPLDNYTIVCCFVR
jgi:protein phosphatase